MSTYLYRLARWCFRHRRRVLAGWLLAVIVVVVLSVVGHGTENNSITIPGTESQQVVDLLQQKIPAFSGAQTQIVFVSPGSQSVTSSADSAAIKQAIDQMAKVPQVAQVKDPILTKIGFPRREGRAGHAAVEHPGRHRQRLQPVGPAGRRRPGAPRPGCRSSTAAPSTRAGTRR